jgi:hypothetical protein
MFAVSPTANALSKNASLPGNAAPVWLSESTASFKERFEPRIHAPW